MLPCERETKKKDNKWQVSLKEKISLVIFCDFCVPSLRNSYMVTPAEIDPCE